MTSLTWAGDGAYLAVGNDRGEVEVWDAETGTKLRTMGGHAVRIFFLSLAETPPERMLILLAFALGSSTGPLMARAPALIWLHRRIDPSPRRSSRSTQGRRAAGTHGGGLWSDLEERWTDLGEWR